MLPARRFSRGRVSPGVAVREPGDRPERDNTMENDSSSNWNWQGADAGLFENADIWAIRIVGMEPNTHRSYGPNLGRHSD